VIVVTVLAGVLVVALLLVGARLRREAARADAAEATSARLTAELLRREREVLELTPYKERVERAPDWLWTADAAGTVTYSNATALPVGTRLESLGHAGVVRRGERTVDTRSVRTQDGWLGIDRDLTDDEHAPPRVAVVRRPVVDGRREVVGYELVGDGSVLASFSPEELVALAAGRGLWLGLDGDVPPALAAHAPTLQLTPDASPDRARALQQAGFALALDDYAGPTPLLDLCGTVKVHVKGRADEALQQLIAEPAQRGLVLVATHVDDADEFTRCRVLGFSHFQGDFFARPRGGDGPGTGALASLQALGELTAAEASFEDLERIIGADAGLSLALIRHVNSAYFALPRKIDSVREALTLLGTKAVRRWATVVALSSAAEAPDQVVALALLRARMCELLGANQDEDDRDGLFTVGLLSVADALLDTPMETVLAALPLSDEITGALLRHEGRRGRILGTVLRYEQGRFPADTADPGDLAEAYLEALRWADDTGRWLA
jgi:EAL and modified HD-GYP domain-containing signal transduction protein